MSLCVQQLAVNHMGSEHGGNTSDVRSIASEFRAGVHKNKIAILNGVIVGAVVEDGSTWTLRGR